MANPNQEVKYTKVNKFEFIIVLFKFKKIGIMANYIE